ncbi:hypothetical protein [Flavobacterium ginsenosidimutans]|uniref:hypothetical protein n=1 Tax=Flavobacterium ginsenosidimutans TaxID=687844 RepID=UPI003D9602A8
MKKILLVLALALFCQFLYPQVGPTLGVGLEKLTMNKGTIDVKVLTEIIMQKQSELKQEALKRFLFKMFPESDYTTKFYVQNCLNIFLNEKQPEVIEKEILELTTNYALALGITQALIKSESGIFKDLNKKYESYSIDKINFELELEKINKEEKNYYKRIGKLEKEIKLYNFFIEYLIRCKRKNDCSQKIENNSNDVELNKKFEELTKNKKTKDSITYGYIKSQINYLNRLKSRLSKIKMKNNVKANLEIDNEKETKSNQLGSNTQTTNNNQATIKQQITNSKLAIECEPVQNNEQVIETQKIVIKVPFGILLDVVSYTLSNNENVTKKGFFKNKIDYHKDDYYKDITFKAELDSLPTVINKKVNAYSENYDVIKEFLLVNTGKNFTGTGTKSANLEKTPTDVVNQLTAQNINAFNYDEELIGKNDKLGLIKKEVNELSKLIKVRKLVDAFKNIENSFESKLDFKDLKSLVSRLNEIIKNYNLNITVSKRYDESLREIKVLNINDYYKVNIPENDPAWNKIVSSNNKIINDFLKDNKVDKYLELKAELEKISVIDSTIKPQINEFLSKIILPDPNIKMDLPNEIKTNVDDLFKVKNLSVCLDSLIVRYKKQITKSKDFFKIYLDTILRNIEDPIKIPINLDTISKNKISHCISELHSKIYYLTKSENIKIEDLNFLEEMVSKDIIEAAYLDNENKDRYINILNRVKLLIPLLKIQILSKIDQKISYKPEMASLFEFISNLDNLDKAQTYESIINLLREYSQKVQEQLPESKFKESYIIFINGMKKYTLINSSPQNQYVEIDIVSFLNDLQQFYNRNNPSRFSLYLTLGLNENFFFKDFTFPDDGAEAENPDNPKKPETIKTIGFASEKIGVKYKIYDFKKYRGYENVIKDDVYLNKRAPFINEFYTILYGSGLLYTLANTSTDQNFDFPHLGGGVGLRFYNALDFNVIVGLPFVKDRNFGKDAFIGIGLDIPLGEYLEKVGNKN